MDRTDKTPETEEITPQTFDEERYLLANPDVLAHVYGGGTALDHYLSHGQAEGRRQLTPAALGTDESRARRKFRRFEPVLDAAAGDGRFRPAAADGEFPLLYGAGSQPFDLSSYDSESANPAFQPFIDQIVANPDRLYLDVGCGRRNYTFDNCLYVEVYPSASADIVMEPSCRYPIASNSIDGIGCFAVLEHVPDPWAVAAEFRRILKPGGKVFIDWPFLQPLHGYPSHYFNVTHLGLQHVFDEGFALISNETCRNQTPDHALTWMLRGIVDCLEDAEIRTSLLNATVADLIVPASTPLWDRVLAAMPSEAVRRYAAGNTLIASKI